MSYMDLIAAKELLTRYVLERDEKVDERIIEAEALLADVVGDRPEDFEASRERPANPAHAHESAHGRQIDP